jgi:hypothetical protein
MGVGVIRPGRAPSIVRKERAMLSLILRLAAASVISVALPTVAPAVDDDAAPPTELTVTQEESGEREGAHQASDPVPSDIVDFAAISTAEELLGALETIDRDLRDVAADIEYLRSEALIGEDERWRGRLAYRVIAHPERPDATVRQFAISFEQLLVGNRLEEDRRDFVFDGRWLVERLPAQRQMFKREVVPPGDEFDPLAVGEGPFPIPIGQKRDEILAIYDAALLAPGGESWEQNMHHLRLTPRPGAESDLDVVQVDLWYLKKNLLPFRAETLDTGDNLTRVSLFKLRKNEGVDPAQFDTTTPTAGWDVEITPYER